RLAIRVRVDSLGLLPGGRCSVPPRALDGPFNADGSERTLWSAEEFAGDADEGAPPLLEILECHAGCFELAVTGSPGRQHDCIEAAASCDQGLQAGAERTGLHDFDLRS